MGLECMCWAAPSTGYAAARLPRAGSRWPTKTTRPPTKATSSWRYDRFQHFGWLGPPHIGQSAPACCAVSTFALQLMILQFSTPFCLQFWIKSASACAWVASAKSLCSYPRLSLPSVPFIPHPQACPSSGYCRSSKRSGDANAKDHLLH